MSEKTPDGDKPAERPESVPPPADATQPGNEPTSEGAPASGAGAPADPGPGAAPAGPPPAGAPATGTPGGGYAPPSQPAGPPPQGAPGGYGGPPPQGAPGGYGGPPPQGAPGGYGGPPPSASPGGYAPLAPAPQATDGFAWGWNAFKANAGTLILGQLAWVLIVIVVTGLWLLILSATGVFAGNTSSEAAAGAFVGLGIAGFALVSVVAVLVGIFAAAGMSNVTLKLVRGEPISVPDFFRIPHPGTIVLVAVVLAVASAILSFTFVGPIILTFFAVYVVLFVIDQGQDLVQAIKSGVKMSLAYPGQTIVLLLLAYLANFVGSMLCGIGTLVSLPLTALATAWLYRSQLGPLQQQPR